MAGEELMDVCVVTQPLSSAGEAVTESLLDILSAITTVSLLTPYLPAGSAIRERYDVIELGDAGTGEGVLVPAVRFALNQVRMALAVRRVDEEVVLFFGPTSYLLPIVVARVAGKTVVLEPRGDVPLTLRLYWERRVPRPVARLLAGGVWLLERIGFRVADAIVVYTPGVADQLDLDRYDHKLYTEGARFVDTETFYPRVPFEEREAVVGFLGRLDEEKGIRLLAEVAKRLPEDVGFRFVGDGDLRGWLEAELAEEIADGRVEVVGWVDHERVPEELSRFKLLVMPSQPTEGLPTVILEAMACGTPVLATPVSGVPDVVEDGTTGRLLRRTDPEAIAGTIAGLVDDPTCGEMSSRARRRIADRFAYESAVDRYRGVISGIASQST